MQVALIASARWVVDVENEKVLDNHSVVVDDKGIIIDILPTSEITEEKYIVDDDHHVKLPEHALLPGLVNMHTHSAMTLFRSIIDDVPLHTWLEEYIWPAERQWVSEEFVQAGVEQAIVEMIRSGTTCFNDQYFYPDVTAKVADQCGLRAAIGVPLINVQTNWSPSPADAFKKLEALRVAYKDHPRIQVVVAPHAPYTVTDEILQEIKVISDEHNMLVHMHLHEASHEVCPTTVTERPLARMKRLGLLNNKLIAVHMVHVNDEEIEWLKENKVNVVTCPESNLKLGNGICSANKMFRSTNLAIGTDGASSNDDLDLIGEIKTAALLDDLKSVEQFGSLDQSISNKEWLKIGSLNGAKALRIDDKVGSLTVGKFADMCALKINAFPVYDVINTIVLNSTNRVSDVWVGGRPLMRNDKILVLDEEKVQQNSSEWGSKIIHSLKLK